MSFKFFVGHAVEYTSVGEKAAGLYKVVRQMPEEEQAFDLRYRIKSEAEAYERNVLECQPSSTGVSTDELGYRVIADAPDHSTLYMCHLGPGA